MAAIARSIGIASVALVSVACGGQPQQTQQKKPLEVAASPPGFAFTDSATVQLISSRPATIYFALNGDDPTGPKAQTYGQPLQLVDSTLVSFIATSDDGVWSAARTEQYMPVMTVMPTSPQVIARGLLADETGHFFAPRPGDPPQTTAFHIRSIGLDSVHISSIQLTSNPHGQTYDQGSFQLTGDVGTMQLDSGKTMTLDVTYVPSETLSSAAIVIESDDQRNANGELVIELWGRVL
jgi:hypothetical protein